LEAQGKDIVNQNIDEVNVISAIKQQIRFISVALDGGKAINLPVRYSLNVSEAYHDSFEKTNDCRAAFCAMVYQMVEDNKGFADNENELSGLTQESIKFISDEELKKIGEALLQEIDSLKKHYNEDKGNNFFERFHAAISGEKKEIEEKLKRQMEPLLKSMQAASKISSSVKISPSIQSLFNTINTINRSLPDFSILDKSLKTAAQINNLGIEEPKLLNPKDIMKDIVIEHPSVRTNKLLQEVSRELQELNQREDFHFEKSIEINKKIADVLFDQYQAQKKAEKVNRITQIFAILASIASILGLFGIDRIQRWIINIWVWIKP